MSKKMSITRILKLAEMYGPFVRFSPEGNQAVDEAIKAAEEAELEGNAAFDKARQAADQERANATKARAAAEVANSQLSVVNSQLESLKTQLEEATAKASAGNVDIELNEEDYSDTDLALVKSIKALNAKIDAKDAKINNLEKKASDFESSKAAESARSAQEAQYQELLNDMDEDHGPQYRNAAVTAFEALRAAGKTTNSAPKNTRLLEKCYVNAKNAVKAKEANIAKGNVRLDSGSGGGSNTLLSGVELKSGSLEYVTAQAGKILNKTGT